MIDSAKKNYINYILKNGIRNSKKREKIIDIFLNIKKHITINDLYNKVVEIDNCIGQATVYRAMKIMCDCGIAEEIDVGDGTKRYEHKFGNQHHDHLICIKCGKFIEVVNPNIERLQMKMCQEHGFKSLRHKLHIFGICKDCNKENEELF